MCKKVIRPIMWFFGHPFAKLFWFDFWLNRCKMSILFMSHSILQIKDIGSCLSCNLFSLNFHLLNHWFNSGWGCARGVLHRSIDGTVSRCQILESKLRLEVPDWCIRGLVLISLDDRCHPVLFLWHENGSNFAALCLNDSFLCSLLHLVEISELWSRTEPTKNGLSVACLWSVSRWVQDPSIYFCGFDEQPVRVQRVQQFPV